MSDAKVKSMLETAVVVRVSEGLHARPATQFAKLAKEFSCSLQVLHGSTSADAKSAVKLMLLGIREHDQIVLRADGADESDAVERMARFLSSPEAGVQSATAAQTADATACQADAAAPPVPLAAADTQDSPPPLTGVPASDGLAFGDAYVYLPEPLRAARQWIEPHEIDAEQARFKRAFDDALAALAKQFDALGDTDDIADALASVAQSDEFAGEIRARVQSGRDAVAATLEVGASLAASFEKIDDEYLRSRADDIHGMTRQIVLRLTGQQQMSLAGLTKPCIVLASDLTAPDLARANVAHIAALVCTRGSATSHLAIIARSHGIPAVFGLQVADDRLRGVRQVAVDGTAGHVWLEPPAALQAQFAPRIGAARAQRAALDVYRDVEPVTRAGRRIRIAANLGSPTEIDAARAVGAMGVGLFRTELLFMNRRSLPGEHEQADVYRRVAQAFAPHPVVIRTLDVGGDKPVPGIAFPHEDNPFLGWRGVRMCIDRPDVFKPQLRALLRAATVGNVHAMLPMIADLDEVRRVKALIAECARELKNEGVAFGEPKLGIMIETPAAALTADLLAPEVDFFSIGTNDLTQYVMAADRANPHLASLYRSNHPAVLRAIGMVCEAAHRAGIEVAVCGEAASQPDMIAVLIGLGVDELSMSPACVLRAKKIVSEC
ncbi:phosphoenolpyruvate--protein phosphotransferase [Paraburkholderia rhizosphaerae]|uniref:phosphoenolpyruvate--protein phosphotransferase n=1 Tax=Paraburkholderia rhizosphaerae TaxID=480658 RepID=A0A4V3HEE3_9BURK|nr:phosphoenolpyruvate--protein phosphotransferase [Paraburkholderia rhizosphaerae]TDY46548.1 phosphoenolpyruvate--protein phosphotransferase [Paraburkholderia rhizosphaerae]